MLGLLSATAALVTSDQGSGWPQYYPKVHFSSSLIPPAFEEWNPLAKSQTTALTFTVRRGSNKRTCFGLRCKAEKYKALADRYVFMLWTWNSVPKWYIVWKIYLNLQLKTDVYSSPCRLIYTDWHKWPNHSCYCGSVVILWTVPLWIKSTCWKMGKIQSTLIK